MLQKNQLYDLPEEIITLIFNKVYGKVVKEIRNFILFEQPYIFRKINALTRNSILFIVDSTDCLDDNTTEFVFVQNQKNYLGNRNTYFLNFADSFLHVKKHPTGLYELGHKIEYVYSDDENENDSTDDDENDDE